MGSITTKPLSPAIGAEVVEVDHDALLSDPAVPEAVLDDSDFDIWNELRGPIAEAVALKIDQAVFAGVDKAVSD